ncbi:transposase [Fodinibius salsisoli]|uniref:Transposase n=1 Tax=Fodinibius salsisoli TaxID=2820877 RepID=A0ABT3PRH1_9BACT|nr:transposase [Fodinibius salsisoli]MCW9708460.1 transposase [Fodinibius salsisoli]
MSFYKRKLPHWQPEGGEHFITIRLKGSLPGSAINRLKNLRRQLNNADDEINEGLEVLIQRKIFKKYEEFLDEGVTGPTWLRRKNIAAIVRDSLHFYDSQAYDLYAYCLMPNHVHVAFKHLDIQKEPDESRNDYPITKIMQSIKSYSALKCNKILNRKGTFWQPESYDRVIRDYEELENTIRYILNNPVKAGLVQKWERWPHNYCKSEFIKMFKTT